MVANARSARDKKHLDRVGTFNPIPSLSPTSDPNAPPVPTKHIELNFDRIKYWLGVGAQPTDRVAWLLAKV